VFAVNDLREYGDYVGHHNLVMENGVPANAQIFMHRKGGFAYDLVNGREMRVVAADDSMYMDTIFGPCEGRLYMITDQPIDSVRIAAPATVAQGASADVKITIADPQGAPISAVIPLRVDILDFSGRESEFTGFYGAKDGQLSLRLDLAPNDSPGIWTVRAKELASGKAAVHYMRITALTPGPPGVK
jgi:hypothetical protein